MGRFVYLVNGTRRFVPVLENEAFINSCVEYGDEIELVGYVG